MEFTKQGRSDSIGRHINDRPRASKNDLKSHVEHGRASEVRSIDIG